VCAGEANGISRMRRSHPLVWDLLHGRFPNEFLQCVEDAEACFSCCRHCWHNVVRDGRVFDHRSARVADGARAGSPGVVTRFHRCGKAAQRGGAAFFHARLCCSPGTPGMLRRSALPIPRAGGRTRRVTLFPSLVCIPFLLQRQGRLFGCFPLPGSYPRRLPRKNTPTPADSRAVRYSRPTSFSGILSVSIAGRETRIAGHHTAVSEDENPQEPSIGRRFSVVRGAAAAAWLRLATLASWQ